MRLAAGICALLLAGTLFAAGSPERPYGERADVRAFVREMVRRHGFVERELLFAFSRARRVAASLKAVAPPPAERVRSWAEYRSTFVNDRRIDAGLDFWRRNEAALARAGREYGVPEEVIVAILGVETYYGRQVGRWRVIDTLTTLAFDYPPRAGFFRDELENYLLFARESGTDVFSVRGSYAGAIGIPQFMPGSYLKFAVDFDGDGHSDLRDSPADAVGSVANFLRQHGWRSGGPVSLPVEIRGNDYRRYADGDVLPRHTLNELASAGVALRSAAPADAGKVALIELETPGEPSEFRVGFENFYVLTRYNRSSFYAAAVADLAAALRAAR